MGGMAAIVRELMAAGIDGEALVEAVARIEASQAPVRTARQERNARYYQARKAEAAEGRLKASEKRLKTSETSETSEKRLKASENNSPLNDPPALTSTVENNLNPPKESTPIGVPKKVPNRWPEGSFDRFWKAYEHRVGKKAARAKFEQIERSGEVALEEVLAGVERYKLNKPAHHDWKNPATWLHQGCWTDEYAQPVATGPPPAGERSLALVSTNGNRSHVVQADRKPSPTDILRRRIAEREAREREFEAHRRG